MARNNAFSVKIETSTVEALADRLGEINAARLGETLVDTINEVADSAYELSRRTITTGINLTDAYVQRRMELKPATKARPTAEIVAPFGKKNLTNLSHYGAQVGETKPVNWTNERIADEVFGGTARFGPWPGWTKRTGTAHMGIPEGRKAYKMTAEVARGSRKSIGKKFTLPGKRDTEGNPLVFERTGPGGKDGKGNLQSLLGPSVYQLFRVAAENIEERVGNDLRDAVVDAAERAFRDALA